MLETFRVKKTKQIVYPIGPVGKGGHTLCLFPLGFTTRAGNRSVIQPVRNENLVKDREQL